MLQIFNDEQLENIYKDLGFINLRRFKVFLANFNDLSELNENELNNQDFYEEMKKDFFKRMDKFKVELTNKSSEEIILIIIDITKQLYKEFLLEKLKSLDETTAEQLVLYGYTHGSCGSLALTLTKLFKEAEHKLFKVENYAHQCVVVNGKCYDIRGCSTIEEMQSFVALEGKCKPKQCEIKGYSKLWRSHKALDYFITRYFQDELKLNKDDDLLSI